MPTAHTKAASSALFARWKGTSSTVGPSSPYDTSEVVGRIADGFHRVLFDTNTYSVPRNYVGFRLYVRASEDQVRVYDSAIRLIAEHERVPSGSHEDRELPEHRRQRRIDIDKVIERFESWGERAATFAQRLRQQRRFAGKELSAVLALQAEYSVESILGAVDHALHYDAYDLRSFTRILQVHAEPLSREAIVTDRIRTEIRRALAHVPVRQRQLAAYKDILNPHEDNTEEPDDPQGSDPT